MDDLIEAFKIFRKYSDTKYPTHCEHDVMYVQVDPNKVGDEDLKKLNKLGFNPSQDDLECFYSYKFGSC